jgi:hypothetical protein
VVVSGIADAIQVSDGGSHTCALLANGTIQCWGHSDFGELGNTTSVTSPVTISGITDAVAIDAHEEHSCVLLRSGLIQCWGYNYYGQVGNGTSGSTSYTSPPVVVTGIPSATAVAAGFEYSCAVLNGGTIDCWGNNAHGQLGNGTTTDSPVPVPVSGF